MEGIRRRCEAVAASERRIDPIGQFGSQRVKIGATGRSVRPFTRTKFSIRVTSRGVNSARAYDEHRSAVFESHARSYRRRTTRVVQPIRRRSRTRRPSSRARIPPGILSGDRLPDSAESTGSRRRDEERRDRTAGGLQEVQRPRLRLRRRRQERLRQGLRQQGAQQGGLRQARPGRGVRDEIVLRQAGGRQEALARERRIRVRGQVPAALRVTGQA